MEIPLDYKYSSDHEWVKSQSDVLVRVGITDYAQDALGDIVYVELPEVGAVVESAQSVSEVESTKSVSDIYAPVPGKVVSINTEVQATPEVINQDPYGKGWLFEIEIDKETDISFLLDAAGYRAVTEV